MAAQQRESEMSDPTQGTASQSTQVKSRQAWERVMGANSPSPVKYDKTSVLILGWEENSDDTRTAEEVRYFNPSVPLVSISELIQPSSSLCKTCSRTPMGSPYSTSACICAYIPSCKRRSMWPTSSANRMAHAGSSLFTMQDMAGRKTTALDAYNFLGAFPTHLTRKT